MECVTLQRLIQLAYGTFADGANPNMQMLQILGAPGWTQSEFYNLTAKAEGAARVEQMMGPMMRALLEDRFKLKIHRETKEMPVYALTLAKSGIKAHPMKEGDCVAIDPNHLPTPTPGQPMPNFCGKHVDEDERPERDDGRSWNDPARFFREALYDAGPPGDRQEWSLGPLRFPPGICA
jgi:uncharacterized protein (TIGR03435 family)